MALAGYEQGDLTSGLQSIDTKEVCRTLDIISELGESDAIDMGYAPNVAALLTHPEESVVMRAAEAIGNMGSAGAEYMGAIADLLKSGSPKRETFAVGSLGMLGPLAAGYMDDVEAKLTDPNSNPSLRASSCITLGCMKAFEKRDAVRACLEDEHPSVVRGALTALALLDDGTLADQVAGKLSHANKEVRISAILYFTKFGHLAPVALCERLKDKDATVREKAVSLFSTLKAQAVPLIPEAAKILEDAEPGSRAAAALALGAIGAPAWEQAPEIAKLLQDESEDKEHLVYCIAGIENKPSPRRVIPACAAASALALLEAESFAEDIERLLASEKADVKIAAVAALGDLGTGSLEGITPLLEEPRAAVKAAALTAMGQITKAAPEADAAAKVAALLTDSSPAVRAAALGALGLMGEEGATYADTFKDMFDDRAVAVKVAAIKALGGIGPRGQLYAPDVCRCIYEEDAAVRLAAIETLPEMGERGAAFADEVAEVVQDIDPDLRIAAIKALAKMGDAATPFMFAVEAAKNDPTELPAVQDAAKEALSASLALE